MKIQDITGAWKLISMEIVAEDGEKIYPYGKDVIGQIMFDDRCNVSTYILTKGRARFQENYPQGGTYEEIKPAFNGVLGYFGTIQIFEPEHEGRHVVLHKVEGSTFPNWEGEEQFRFYKLENERLTITSLKMVTGGQIATPALIWERK